MVDFYHPKWLTDSDWNMRLILSKHANLWWKWVTNFMQISRIFADKWLPGIIINIQNLYISARLGAHKNKFITW